MTKQLIEIDLETARLIRKVFLPANPRKMRAAHPDVVQAAIRFIEAVESAPSPAPSSL